MYRVLWTELKSGAVRGEMPATALSYEEVVNSPGSANITIPLDPSRQAEGLEAIQPGMHGVWVERDGVLMWGGILWAWNANLEAGSLELRCEGMWSYFRRRFVREKWSNTGDPVLLKSYNQVTDILIRNMGSGFTPDPGQVVYEAAPLYELPKLGDYANYPNKGYNHERTYWRHERKQVAELVEQLAAVDKGFLFRHTPVYSAETGNPIMRIEFLPQNGQATGIHLRHGDNCNVTEVSSDATSMVTLPWTTGAGDGSRQLSSESNALEPSDGGEQIFNNTLERRLPRLESVESFSDVTKVSTLNGKARKMRQEGSAPVVMPSILLHPGVFPGIGEIRPGDKVTAAASLGLVSFDAEFVVTTVAVEVSGPSEHVTLTVAPSEVF